MFYDRDILAGMDDDWLTRQFELYPHKSKAGLARALGLEPPAISKILKGTRQIKAKEFAIMQSYFLNDRVAARLGKNYADLTKEKVAHIQALSDAQAVEHDALSGDWFIPETVLKSQGYEVPEEVKVFRIDDAFMVPDFQEGEFVLVDMSVDMPSPPGYFVITDGYTHFTRQCEILTKNGQGYVQVSARDKAFSTQKLSLNEVQVVGRVIARLTWL